MQRLTTDKPDGNLQAALNMFYAKDGQAWVRGGGPWPKYPDVMLNDYIRRAIKQVATCPPMFDELDDLQLAEVMSGWCMDGIDSHEGIIGMLYTAGWVCAELRERLKMYEETGLTPEQVAAQNAGKPLTEFLHPVDDYKGLKAKFMVFKADSGEKVENCFVLCPGKDAAAVEALRTYAWYTNNTTLARDIYNWVGKGTTVQKWIRAEEELPGQEEVGKYYAQYGEHPKYIVMIAGAVQSTVLAFDGEDFYDPADNEIYKVTHWMPLPAAPQTIGGTGDPSPTNKK